MVPSRGWYLPSYRLSSSSCTSALGLRRWRHHLSSTRRLPFSRSCASCEVVSAWIPSLSKSSSDSNEANLTIALGAAAAKILAKHTSPAMRGLSPENGCTPWGFRRGLLLRHSGAAIVAGQSQSVGSMNADADNAVTTCNIAMASGQDTGAQAVQLSKFSCYIVQILLLHSPIKSR